MQKIEFKKIRKSIALVLILVFALGLVQGCSKDSSETNSTPVTAADTTYEPFDVRVGINTSSYAWPFFVARDAGIFKKYNINVTIDSYASGGETLDAVALKNADIGEAADYAFAIRLVPGTNLRAVLFFGESDAKESQLYVNDDDIKTVADLVGKKIGVKKGTVNEYTWGKLFEQAGIDINNVTQVNLSSDAELITAYAQDQIDAYWTSGSNYEKLKSLVDESKLRSIGDQLTLTGTASRSFVIFSSEFIENNPEGAERFLKAYAEAIDYFKSHTDESTKIIADAVTLDAQTVKEELTAYNWTVQFKQLEYDYLKDVAKWAIENNATTGSYNLADYIDLNPLKAILPDNVDVTLN